MLWSLNSLGLFAVLGVGAVPPPRVTIPSTHPAVYKHGRWDENVGSWWAGTGFKLDVVNLHNLVIDLGEYTTHPSAAAAISLDGGKYFTVNLSAGENVIPLDTLSDKGARDATLVEINVQGWQNNRIHFKNVILNADAKLVPYKPKRRVIQFVGDSLSSGQFLPLGVNQAWPFIAAKKLGAEAKINAQPGATFFDMESYGNVHGVSYQFFKTEDTGYVWTHDHNYTTDWDIRKEEPKTTDLVIHIGANDASHNVPSEIFIETYLTFLDKVVKVSPALQNIYILTPFGWPNENGEVYYYYDGVYAAVAEQWRRKAGPKSKVLTHLIDCTGWISFADVFPDNVHPNIPGHENIASKVIHALSARR